MKLILCILLIFCSTANSFTPSTFPAKSIDLMSLFKSTQNRVGMAAQNFLATKNINEDDINSDNQDGSDGTIAVMEQFFYGSWLAASGSSAHQFGDFSQNTGYSAFVAQDENSDGIDDDIYFWFYDGQYVDQKLSIINFHYDNSTDFNVQNSTFRNSSIVFTLYKRDNFKKTGTLSCTGSYQLSLADSTTNLPFNETSSSIINAVAYFWLDSPDCKISLHAQVAIANAMPESKALDYSLMVTGICLAHLYAVVQMIKNISLNEYDGARYSLITLSIFAIWDVFMCLFHLYGALSIQNFFHYFITPAFWYFILASIFETRLILIVWKTRYYQSFQTVNEIRRGITKFYFKFYGAMLILLFIAYNFLPATWLLCLTSTFFIPQIIHNAMRGQRYRFDFLYVFLLGFVRIAVPLYVRGCPAAIFKLTPSNSYLEFYVGFVTFQIFLLYLQAKLGSRFFIPRCLLPPKYNYYMKLAVDASHEEAETCSICMENLNEAMATSSTGLLASPKQVTVMITPCRHKFHPTCLRQWMEIKLECPFCRATVPPID